MKPSHLKINQFLIAATLLLPPVLANAESKPSKGKSSLNTQVFEKDSSEESFTAKVSVVREIQDETEVFFEGQKKGPYTLPDGPSHGLYMQRLEKSKKTSGPSVKVVIDNDRIQSVEISEQQEPEAKASDEDLVKTLFRDR